MSYLEQLFSLEGQIALVTGASRGLGQAITEALLRAGAQVIMVSANQERLTAAMAALQAQSLPASMHCCDLADNRQIATLVETLHREPGRIDILVNIVHPIQVTEGYAHVPAAPGLGIEVDEAALVKYKMEPPYEIPRPRLLLSVVWPGNRVRHYGNLQQCWTDAFAGNIPVQDRAVRMVVRRDDGSPAWTEVYDRATVAPFWSSSL